MANNSFKVKNSLVLTPKDLPTLVSPEAGDLACDINDSNKIKRYDAASASWVEVGSGGGVGGVDIFFVQDFESASLSSFTQTGLVLSQTDPLKGKVSAVLTHQAAINQSFKQIIPVDRKFRGESVTLSLDAKSSASQGNLVIKITNETASTDIVASEQLVISNDVSGAKSSVTFTIPSTCASLSYTITALPQAGSPVSRIDDIICQLTQSVTIQSGLIQDGDSQIRLSGANGFGSTATTTRRFSTINSSVGSDIQYIDSTTLGGQFVVQKAGIYNVSYTEYSTANVTAIEVYIRVNGTIITADQQILNTATVASKGASTSWSGYLNVGDIVTGTASVAVANDGNFVSFTISRAGSLKQVTPNSNQKAVIPTSELRFTGSSSRGTADSGTRVKFDTLANIRGDAFTVTNDATGTAVAITKAGRISASFALVQNTGTYAQLYISGTPVAIDAITSLGGGSAWTGDVKVGDIIYVVAGAVPTANAANGFHLSFQEQSIQVSVSNTLPQFSESDSCVRVSGANGFGSTATGTRRFASVAQNIGNAIQYVDNAALGGQFIAQEAGIYNISFSESSTANDASMTIFLALNGTAVATDNQVYNTLTTGDKRASVSWSGYLNAGDIITANVNNAAQNNGVFTVLTISKVGKPNVTGVDVTPFITTAFDVGQIGEVKAFAGNVDPTYFLVCDGRAVSRTGYADLFRAIGTTHGQGDGSTTFNLPDYRGRFLRGVDGTAGNDPDKASRTAMNTGGNTGNAVGSVQADANAAHFHESSLITAANDSAFGRGSVGQGILGSASGTNTRTYTNTVGGNESRPKNAYVNYGIRWKAAMDMVLSPTQTFSTDTAALVYAPINTYTFSTLANAPVGTFLTYTYAANTNTRTQTTTAPTQTTADMNANGILLYNRQAYTGGTSAAQPVCFAIQIGKGLKGLSKNLYVSAGKSGGTIDSDFYISGTTDQRGLRAFNYNEITGILLVDAGQLEGSTITNNRFYSTENQVGYGSGYLVINASTNPALTGMNINKVMARGVNSNGQSVTNTAVMTFNAIKTFDTHGALNTTTGAFTAPESGYYQVNARATCAAQLYTATNQNFYIQLRKNGSLYSTSSLAVSWSTTASVILAATLNDVVYLAKGDTIDTIPYNDRGAGTLFPDANFNYLSIAKISN